LKLENVIARGNFTANRLKGSKVEWQNSGAIGPRKKDGAGRMPGRSGQRSPPP